MRRSSALASLVLIASTGSCVFSSGGRGSQEDRLTVFAASSLTEVFTALEPDARYSFAGSDELAAQIREGAPADVYAAASPSYADELFAAGLVERPIAFATNELVLIVGENNPAGIDDVDDLADEDVKLVIGADGVPVGDYTRAALEDLGRTDILEQVVSYEQDARGVVGKVALGEADAGFAYATDVEAVEEDVDAISLPERARPRIRYLIAVVRGSDLRRAARAFVERILSSEGRAALVGAGFGPP